MTEQLQTNYLGRYEGFLAEIYQVGKFDESSAVRTTYLGIRNMTREDSLKTQEPCSLTDQSITIGILLDDNRILLDGTDCKHF